MKKLLINSSVATALLGFSQVALAATNISQPKATFGTAGIGALITQLNRAIDAVVPFLVGLAVLVVIYEIFTYIRFAEDEEKRASAKMMMVWGVIGIFVMLSIWGLVSILENTFTFEKTGEFIEAPTFNAPVGSNAGGGINSGVNTAGMNNNTVGSGNTTYGSGN